MTSALQPSVEQTPKDVKGAHLGYLDGLRALAALYVVLHHAHMYYDTPDLKLVKRLGIVFSHGHYAVNLFIVLSGFCLFIPIVKNQLALREGALNFIKKRAKRILPPYYITMLFSLVFIGLMPGVSTTTVWGLSTPISLVDVLTHVLLIHDLFINSASKINYIMWSISVEWRIYLLFPFILLCWRRVGGVAATFLLLFFSIALAFILALEKVDINFIRPHYLGLFVLGMLACQISFSKEPMFERLRETIPFKKLSIGVFVLVLLATFTREYLSAYVPLVWVYLDVLVGIAVAAFLVAVATGNFNRASRALSFKPLVFIGTFSYSIYLIHAPLLEFFYRFVLEPSRLPGEVALTLFFLAGLPLIIVASYFFFLLAEKPFMNKRKQEVLAACLTPVINPTDKVVEGLQPVIDGK